MPFGRLSRFLRDNTFLACLLAASILCVSLVFLILGLDTVRKQNQVQPEPQSVTMQELEANASLLDAEWLECRDGYLFWPAAAESVTQTKKPGVEAKTTEKVEHIYVPLLSKAAFDNWHTLVALNGDQTYLPYNECRVVVKFTFADLRGKFPELIEALRDKKPFNYPIEPQPPTHGPVRLLEREPKFIVDGIRRKTSGFDAKKILVMDPGKPPFSYSEINRIAAVCFTVLGALGVVGVVPYVIWIVRGWRKPKGEDFFEAHSTMPLG